MLGVVDSPSVCEMPVAVRVCTVCGSDRHMEHACFIAHGMPARVKMRADKVVELCRLHSLHVQGAFDWHTTPTSLAWMLRLRVKHALPASALPADSRPELNPDGEPAPGDIQEPYPDHISDPRGLHGPGGEAEANGCDCAKCDPDHPNADWHGHGGIAWGYGCDCVLCDNPLAGCLPDPEPAPAAPDEGYSSALEDSVSEPDYPPGASIPPEHITPAVARARWRARLGIRLPALTRARDGMRRLASSGDPATWCADTT